MGVPNNGWFIRETPTKMDDNWRYPYDLGNPHMVMGFTWIFSAFSELAGHMSFEQEGDITWKNRGIHGMFTNWNVVIFRDSLDLMGSTNCPTTKWSWANEIAELKECHLFYAYFFVFWWGLQLVSCLITCGGHEKPSILLRGRNLEKCSGKGARGHYQWTSPKPLLGHAS